MTGAVVVRRQNTLMQRFRDAKAMSRKSAISLADIGCRDSWVFRRMVAREIFIDTGDGQYFMDEEAAQRFVHRRRQRMIAFTATVIVVFLVWLLCTYL